MVDAVNSTAIEREREISTGMPDVPNKVSESSGVQRSTPWTVRKIFILASLFLVYFVVFAAYSVYAPFFPSEVSVIAHRACQITENGRVASNDGSPAKIKVPINNTSFILNPDLKINVLKISLLLVVFEVVAISCKVSKIWGFCIDLFIYAPLIVELCRVLGGRHWTWGI